MIDVMKLTVSAAVHGELHAGNELSAATCQEENSVRNVRWQPQPSQRLPNLSLGRGIDDEQIPLAIVDTHFDSVSDPSGVPVNVCMSPVTERVGDTVLKRILY
jgi:hypothetical protein